MSLFEIFQPGHRHGREQRDLENMLVLEDSQGRGPWEREGRIDLDGGKAVLKARPAPAVVAEADEAAQDEEELAEPPADS